MSNLWVVSSMVAHMTQQYGGRDLSFKSGGGLALSGYRCDFRMGISRFSLNLKQSLSRRKEGQEWQHGRQWPGGSKALALHFRWVGLIGFLDGKLVTWLELIGFWWCQIRVDQANAQIQWVGFSSMSVGWTTLNNIRSNVCNFHPWC